jgi:hypothetical protein
MYKTENLFRIVRNIKIISNFEPIKNIYGLKTS